VQRAVPAVPVFPVSASRGAALPVVRQPIGFSNPPPHPSTKDFLPYLPGLPQGIFGENAGDAYGFLHVQAPERPKAIH